MTPKQYWHILTGSLTQPTFYVQVLNQPFRRSLQFFLISSVLLGIASAWLMIQYRFPEYQRMFKEVTQEISQNYPDELSIQWQDQTLSTSNQEPLMIPYPHFFQAKPTQVAMVIDPSLDTTQFDQLNQRLPASSLSVVGSTQLLINDGLGNWSVLALADLPYFDQNFTINQQTLPGVLDQANHHFQQLLQLISPTLYVIWPLIYMFKNAWIILWYAIVGQFILSWYGKNFGFKKIYQLSLHLIVVAQLVEIVGQYLYPDLTFSLLSLTFWCLFIALSFTLKRVSAVKVVIPTSPQK